MGVPRDRSRSPEAGTALSYGYAKFSANIWPLISIVLPPVVVQIVLAYIAREYGTLTGFIVFESLAWFFGAVASLGIHRSALLITTGRTPQLGQAFRYDRWGAWLGFSIVYGLIVGIGLALFVIPGLVALAFFGLAPYYFIDRRLGIFGALNASRRTAARTGYALAVLACILVGALGTFFCCIGWFISVPTSCIAVAFLYRNAAEQPFAR